MISQVRNYLDRRRRGGLTQDQCRRYNAQCGLAAEAHILRGSPIPEAAATYGVSPGDAFAAVALLTTDRESARGTKEHRAEAKRLAGFLKINAGLLTAGTITPGNLLAKFGSESKVAAMKQVKPWRPYNRRQRVEQLTC